MARKAELNNGWNNVQRVNKQNQFVPSAVLTRTGKIPVNTAKVNAVSTIGGKRETADYPHRALKNKGIVDSGCSRHMTGNKAYLAEFQDFNGGPVAFGGSKGYITGKGKIKTGKLDFEDVCFVKELQHFNLFSVSQMCDKKNKVLFTDSECLVLSPEFKLPDENQVLLKIPRQNNMYSFNLENIVPSGGLACLIAKATTDESNKWHRRSTKAKPNAVQKTLFDDWESEKEDASLLKLLIVLPICLLIFFNNHTCFKNRMIREKSQERKKKSFKMNVKDLRGKKRKILSNEEAEALQQKYEQENRDLEIHIRRLSISLQEDLFYLGIAKADHVATSTTEARNVAAGKLCGQVCGIKTNVDYGIKLHEPKIYIDNESTNAYVKNPINIPKQRTLAIRAPLHKNALRKEN
ncbi:hypothetical protein Tco_0475376 [Tanacetum coccineum]